MFSAAYMGFAVYEIIIGRPLRIILFFLALAVLPEIFGVLYRRRINRRGFVIWKFKVLSDTYFYYKRRKVKCILASPCVAPFADKMFEIVLYKDDELPENGSMIEVCVPGNIRILEADNRYVMAEYYEINELSA